MSVKKHTDEQVFEAFEKVGGSAFPSEWGVPSGGTISSPGMTLRDWFAGQALIAHASTSEWEMLDDLAQKNLAEASYEMADAMLAARDGGSHDKE